MQSSFEKWTERMVLFAAVLLIVFNVGYLGTATVMALDGLAAIFPSRKAFSLTVGVVCAIWGCAWLLLAILTVCWTQRLWRSRFPARRAWVPRLFWICLCPGIGWLCQGVLFLYLAWQEKLTVRLAAIAGLLLTATGLLACLRLQQYFSVLPGGLLLALYVFYLVLLPRLAHLPPSRRIRNWTGAAFLTLLLYPIVLFGIQKYCQNRLADYRQSFRRLGVCTSKEELKNVYLQGQSPDPLWTRLVDCYNPPSGGFTFSNGALFAKTLREQLEIMQREAGSANTDRILFSPIMIEAEKELNAGTLPAETQALLRQIFARNRAVFAQMDAVFNPNSPQGVKYRFPTDRLLIELTNPHLLIQRQCAVLYQIRIMQAMRQGNTQEAMRLMHCFDKLQHSAQDNMFVIGNHVGLAITNRQLDTFVAMLANHQLNDADLRKSEQWLQQTEERIYPATHRAFNGSIAEALDFYENVSLRRFWSRPFEALLLIDLNTSCAFAMNVWLEYCNVIRQKEWNPADQHATDATRFGSGALESPEQLKFHAPAGVWLPAVHSLWDKATQTIARCRMVRLACAVERFRLKHGRIPKHLNELDIKLSDPHTGAPFQYTAKNGFYTLKSAGNYASVTTEPGFTKETP